MLAHNALGMEKLGDAAPTVTTRIKKSNAATVEFNVDEVLQVVTGATVTVGTRRIVMTLPDATEYTFEVGSGTQVVTFPLASRPMVVINERNRRAVPITLYW